MSTTLVCVHIPLSLTHTPMRLIKRARDIDGIERARTHVFVWLGHQTTARTRAPTHSLVHSLRQSLDRQSFQHLWLW
jgi:hypothetical protein